MVKKESVLGSSGAGDNEPAPWDKDTPAATGGGTSAAVDVASTGDGEGELDQTQIVERDLAGLIVPGSGAGRSDVIERLRRAPGATAPGSAVATVGPAVQRLIASLAEEIDHNAGENLGVYEDIATRIERAQTVDDVLRDDSPIDADDVLDVTLQLWGVSINESDYRDGLQAYVALRVIRQDTMEDAVVTCGAFKVVAKALKLQRMNMFPVMVKITQGKRQTKAGNTVLDLVKA